MAPKQLTWKFAFSMNDCYPTTARTKPPPLALPSLYVQASLRSTPESRGRHTEGYHTSSELCRVPRDPWALHFVTSALHTLNFIIPSLEVNFLSKEHGYPCSH